MASPGSNRISASYHMINFKKRNLEMLENATPECGQIIVF
jgi:hypothetical protein